MAYDDPNEVTGRPWTKRMHESTPELRKKFADAIKKLIEENDGEFIGTYDEILKKAELDETYYGDLFNEMNDIKKEYGIHSKRGPRRGKNKGNIYSLVSSFTVSRFDNNSNNILTQISNLLNAKDIDKLTKDQAVSLLKVIRMIIIQD
ncbi:MAG: hypothetical protein ACOCRK_04360 [bacterium]